MPQTLSLNVLLFASWADALGSTVRVELPAGSTVADVLASLSARVSGSALPTPLVAVNQRYARPSDRIAVGDEIAIIPPVAGG
ncbi:MAG: MoaD/ThiS family protein [Gemmatimonadaceae bacterium]